MRIKNAQYRWIIDLILFAGFVLCFFLDFTGLDLHQALGLFGGIFVLYHLAIHWDWVKAVAASFTKNKSSQSRVYFVLDAMLFAGMTTIITTGIIISTWLNLPLGNYQSWVLIHVSAAIVTLLATLLKTSLHWRWINITGHKVFTRRSVRTLPAGVRSPTSTSQLISRREFLKVVVPATAVTVVAVGSAIKGLDVLGLENPTIGVALADYSTPTAAATPASTSTTVQPESASQVASVSSATSAPATPTAIPASQMTNSTTCTVLCPRGCSFPGYCGKYIDTNNNNRCDRGECL